MLSFASSGVAALLERHFLFARRFSIIPASDRCFLPYSLDIYAGLATILVHGLAAKFRRENHKTALSGTSGDSREKKFPEIPLETVMMHIDSPGKHFHSSNNKTNKPDGDDGNSRSSLTMYTLFVIEAHSSLHEQRAMAEAERIKSNAECRMSSAHDKTSINANLMRSIEFECYPLFMF